MAEQQHPSVEEVVRNQKRGTKEMNKDTVEMICVTVVAVACLLCMTKCSIESDRIEFEREKLTQPKSP